MPWECRLFLSVRTLLVSLMLLALACENGYITGGPRASKLDSKKSGTKNDLEINIEKEPGMFKESWTVCAFSY